MGDRAGLQICFLARLWDESVANRTAPGSFPQPEWVLYRGAGPDEAPERNARLRPPRRTPARQLSRQRRESWWAWTDLNSRPRPYQGRALAT